MIKIQILGNLGQDAEVKVLQGGATVIVFTVAHTENYTDKQGNKQSNTTWVRCAKWVNQGQSTKIAEFLKKGTKVYVEGKPYASAYIGNDGAAKSNLELTVRDIELSGSAAQQAPAANATTTSQPAAQIPSPSLTPRTVENYNTANGEELGDDLPF